MRLSRDETTPFLPSSGSDQSMHLFGRPNLSRLRLLVAFAGDFCYFKAYRAIRRSRAGALRHLHDLESSSGVLACLATLGASDVPKGGIEQACSEILFSFLYPTRHA